MRLEQRPNPDRSPDSLDARLRALPQPPCLPIWKRGCSRRFLRNAPFRGGHGSFNLQWSALGGGVPATGSFALVSISSQGPGP